jgi:aspartyl-tRNA(Asn)/glutamyl-tRNA(Gln) amidotransferase subunit A
MNSTTKDMSIAAIVAAVKDGSISAQLLVEESLQAIEALNPTYQAIIVTTEKRALKRAAVIDEQARKGASLGPLAGVPFIAKDNFLVFGADTTAGSNMLKGFNAPYQATVIEKLEAAGAICVAKANLDAFAHGSSTENSDFMVTKNPVDTSRVPGGSSGGSAVAVALNIVPFALGTDTGGSIRLPASYCGVVGYKPTYGLVSRSGVVAMASSTDVIGPFAKTVEDTAYVLNVMAGKDPLDSTTIDRDEASYSDLDVSLAGKKIGIIKEYFAEGIDSKVKNHLLQVVDTIKQSGAEIIEVSLPSLPLALAVYYIVVPAEVSSNLSRYDGQRYPYSWPEATNLSEAYEQSRSRGFGAEAKRRIMTGTYVLSSGYYDAYYRKAQTVRTKLINEFNEVFSSVDFLLGPTAPGVAFKIGEHTADPLEMYLTDIMTVAANLVGIPSLSLPVGLVEKLPVGLQLMAPQRHDRQLLGLAKAVEEAWA